MITTAADLALALVGSRAADEAVAAGKAEVAVTTFDTGLLVRVGKCLGDTVASQPPTSITEAVRLTLGCLDLLVSGAVKLLVAPLALLDTLIAPLAAAYDIGQDGAAAGADSQATLVRGPNAACPSPAEFLSAARTAGASVDATVHGDIVCHDHWATAAAYAGPTPPEPPHYVLQFQKGSWKLVTTVIDGYPSDLAQCPQLPAWIKQALFMNCP